MPEMDDGTADLASRLRAHIHVLATEIGERHLGRPTALRDAVRYLDGELSQYGTVNRQPYDVDGDEVVNLDIVFSGRDSREVVVVGAHYDSVPGCPAANDNGSGVAGVLELARALHRAELKRTIRLALFVNEEPPYFHTPAMGSWVYAKGCKARGERVRAMLSLETIGHYTDAPRSQRYPVPVGWLYPSRGNFVGVVGNLRSAGLVRKVVKRFRHHTDFPAQGAAMPGFLTGVGWSDHWSFWKEGFPGVMVTDTALYRYEHYHTPHDTEDKLDYNSMATVVAGLALVVRDLCS